MSRRERDADEQATPAEPEKVMVHSLVGSHTNIEHEVGFQSGMEQMVAPDVAEKMVREHPDQYGYGKWTGPKEPEPEQPEEPQGQ